MRVLCVGNRYPPWSTGGYEATWAATVQAFRRAGRTVRVLTTLPDPTDRRDVGSADPDVHRDLRWYWRAHAFPAVGLRGTVALERENGAILIRHVRDFAPDVVMWWAMGGMSLSLIERARRIGLPALGMVCDDWMLYGPDVDGWLSRWRGFRRPLRPLAGALTGVPAQVDLGRAARWAFISEYTLTAARDAGWRLPDVTIAHAGIDSARFAPRDPKPWRRRLLYCGRIDPRKGVGTAIEALARLPADANLVIDGDGDPGYLSELRTLARRLGVTDRVRFQASPSADVSDAYAAADAVVFPVRWREPWGLVPLEAMAVGRPVIATRSGGGPDEYLQHERNCLLVEPGDAAGVAAAFERLEADASLRAAILAAGRETAARFNDARLHEQLLRELDTVAAR